MIFFRYVGDTVEIVNVIEGHRDIDALFRKSEYTPEMTSTSTIAS